MKYIQEYTGENNMKTFKDIAYATEHENQKLDIYLPDNDTFDVYVYIHGGGMEIDDKETDIVLFESLTKLGVAVVTINYRMYPFARYPEYLYDAAAAVAWTKKHISEYGNAKRIFVGGSSAGGYISMMLYFDRKYLAPFKLSPCDLDGFVFDAGQPTSHFNVLRERGIDSRRVVVDETAPLYHVKEYANEPPVMILVSEFDIKSRFEQTQLLLSTMDHFGYPKEIITYHYMENYHHFGYVRTPVFAELIAKFIEETK